MKKKFIYSFMIAAAAAAFSSSVPIFFGRASLQTRFDEETAFQSPTLVHVNTVASLYNNMFKIMGNRPVMYRGLGIPLSDEAMPLSYRRLGRWRFMAEYFLTPLGAR